MGFLARAVIYGFGFSLGAALFKRVYDELGLDEERNEQQADAAEQKTSDSAPPPETAGA